MSEPVIASKTPYRMDVVTGEDYYWCTCGRSAKQPLCDGAHRGSEFRPLKYTAEETKTVHLCGCKRTAGAPHCDGSHKAL